ncbi:MAG: PQQ-dependent dehydrogenase, methanol/ethanol family [Candidatus Andeanibacterium colombiense]|uniref:PQQ-dependent dehydrogenase, methanol/ethanol family n=1 Tax=Candidatus Andeanibacterium colombiense TaxID=3121345 RepID=A0AAJ5X5X6_9SPHN|nr:MAG: PQQ-dependent dehydrogenase, methanol/ethanol family [Sphingomonadaceae bacterium]
MMKMKWAAAVLTVTSLLLASITASSPGLAAGKAAAVTGETMRKADAPANVGDWQSYSRTWDEQRFSPLTQINDKNVQRLGLAWYADLGTYRGVQASPLVVDGILYNESIYNVVTAYDGKTGKQLWTYDPKVGPEWARLACCGPSARGIAAWHGKLYIGALDGRLIAIDAKDGHEIWTAQTFPPGHEYSITGAPRVYDGKVVIGNGGADYGSRGFVTAWDAETGKKVWKFYIVPTDPAKGPDGEASDSAMKIAQPTWTGNFWDVAAGGGGNAWDSFAYDPDLNTVYIGTGNGSPHMWHFRSPEGGDNLFLCSLVAVDAKTGQYKWHYQMVPEEDWDFTCTQPIVLADIMIDGKLRKVAMQAPKNGFFYVIDRETGEFISGKSYVSVNTWASGIDAKGRPIVLPSAHNTTTPHLMSPSWMAGHTWHPMSYSPLTGLMYFSAQEQGSVYARAEDGKYQYRKGGSNSAQAYGNEPELRAKLQAEAVANEKGYLLAWDPKTQTEKWRVDYGIPGSGGTLATAGNLVIQGTINKTLAIYRADTGAKLWEMNIDQAPVAGPITYSIDGEQYIAINAGWGGSPVYNLNRNGPFRTGTAKLMVFKLDAKGVNLPPLPPPSALPAPPPLRAAESVVSRGRELYQQTCVRCHGEDAIGGVKDLRWMTKETHDAFNDIVLKGIYREKGMVSFADVLKPEDAEAIHQYLIARANEDYADASAKGK